MEWEETGCREEEEEDQEFFHLCKKTRSRGSSSHIQIAIEFVFFAIVGGLFSKSRFMRQGTSAYGSSQILLKLVIEA